MSMFTRKIVAAIAATALAFAAFAGASPAAHADGGIYPPGVYGPGGTCCFGVSGAWFDGGGVGLAGQEVWTYSNGGTVTSITGWNAGGLDPTTLYDVCAFIPDNNADADAQYTVTFEGGDSGPIAIDQSQYTNQWAYIGTFAPYVSGDGTGHLKAHVSDRSDDVPGTTVVGADAMLFIPTNDDVIDYTVGNAGACLPPF